MRRIFISLALALASFAAAACPSLTTMMDAHYGRSNWVYRTSPGTGTDIAPAIYAGVQAAGEVCIGRGHWTLKTPLDPQIMAGASIRGVSSQATLIYFDPPSGEGTAFWFSGADNRTGGGLHRLAIVLEEGLGLSGAIAIKLVGDAIYQPDQMMFSDLYITARGTSYWYAGLLADGRGRMHPQGIRAVSFSNVQIFRAHGLGAWLGNVVQWTLSNVGVYVGLGTGSNFYIAGGGSSLTNSVQVYMIGMAVMGDINLTNTSEFSLSGVCGRIATMTNATRGLVAARCPVVGAFGQGVSFLGGRL